MFFLAFFSAVPAYADGDVYVVDGDSLKLGEQNVRLAHIDAPEYYQTCKRADKSTYNCGIKAREKLESLLKLGKLSCKTVGRDIYNRDMSECFAGRTNINLEMVRSGWGRRLSGGAGRCKTRQTRNMAGQIYEARAVSDFV
jgi:endonuclease YncB( thermonuclease family)